MPGTGTHTHRHRQKPTAITNVAQQIPYQTTTKPRVFQVFHLNNRPAQSTAMHVKQACGEACDPQQAIHVNWSLGGTESKPQSASVWGWGGCAPVIPGAATAVAEWPAATVHSSTRSACSLRVHRPSRAGGATQESITGASSPVPHWMPARKTVPGPHEPPRSSAAAGLSAHSAARHAASAAAAAEVRDGILAEGVETVVVCAGVARGAPGGHTFAGILTAGPAWRSRVGVWLERCGGSAWMGGRDTASRNRLGGERWGHCRDWRLLRL